MRGRRSILTLWVAVGLLLSACGFHLRGTAGIADHLRPLYLGQVIAGEGQVRSMRHSLAQAGALLTQPDQAANRLDLALSRQRDTQLNSRGNDAVVLIELRASLRYALYDPAGEALLPQNTISSSRTVELDASNVLSHEGILERARSDQERALIRSLLNRLRN